MSNTTSDAKYLTKQLTLAQLRVELASARANLHPDLDDYGYWCWYADTVKEAIALKQASQPKVKPKPGHIDVEAVKARVDIISVIEGYGITLRKAGRNFKTLCPFHTEKMPSFTVYPDKQTWHCFGACNTGGDVLAFIMRIENIDFRAALQKVSSVC